MFITISTGFSCYQNHECCFYVNSAKWLQTTGLTHCHRFERTLNMWNTVISLVKTIGILARLYWLCTCQCYFVTMVLTDAKLQTRNVKIALVTIPKLDCSQGRKKIKFHMFSQYVPAAVSCNITTISSLSYNSVTRIAVKATPMGEKSRMITYQIILR